MPRDISLGVAHIAAWQFVAELTLKVYDKLEQLSMRYYQNKPDRRTHEPRSERHKTV